MELRPLYMCDPNLNKQCNKRSCLYRNNGALGTCFCTTQVECAVLDINGRPIAVPVDSRPQNYAPDHEPISKDEVERPWQYTPYKLRLDITIANTWAKYAFLFALLSLLFSATALLLR